MGKLSCITLSITITLAILISLILFIISIIEINMGRKYKYQSRCDQPAHYLITLKYWLYVDGIVSICFLDLMLFSTGIKKVVGKSFAIGSFAFFFIVLFLFQIAWTSVGAVQMFKYSTLCQELERNLYNMTYASLVIRWISLGLTFVIACYIIKKMRDDDD